MSGILSCILAFRNVSVLVASTLFCGSGSRRDGARRTGPATATCHSLRLGVPDPVCERECRWHLSYHAVRALDFCINEANDLSDQATQGYSRVLGTSGAKDAVPPGNQNRHFVKMGLEMSYGVLLVSSSVCLADLQLR